MTTLKASQKSQILEGSNAIARTIKNIGPAVVSAYPITPQTHIVEDLAKFKADGDADYEYVRAESEFAAASIVTGASAAGVRTYTATSSQGLLLMNEVIYNIAGMRLPIVMTLANRGVSAPITIWNDHQDAMSVRDAGWVMLFAEDHQEAVEQHILAYKIAESLKLPVMVNVDGYVLTHTFDSVIVPEPARIKKYLPAYKPALGEYLDVKKPITLGAFALPSYYLEIRQKLHDDIIASLDLIRKEYDSLKAAIPEAMKAEEKDSRINNGLVEYYGATKPDTILIAMGSMVGTIKDTVDKLNAEKSGIKIGVLKIKCFRPFPVKDILNVLKKANHVAVVEKAVSLGAGDGPLALEIKAAAQNKINVKIQSFIVGLGGRDFTGNMIRNIINEMRKKNDGMEFIGK